MKNHSTRFHCKKILRTNHEVTTFYMAILMILMISTFGFSPSAYASEKSPYDSGYDHGCDDEGISDSSERYINQPEKGHSFHTSEFMDGYSAGFGACSDGDGVSSSEVGCYNVGYDHGRNRDFNEDAFQDNCGPLDSEDKYYKGFIDGCLSVEGNTRDVCESATDV